jgi:hypothetical protein
VAGQVVAGQVVAGQVVAGQVVAGQVVAERGGGYQWPNGSTAVTAMAVKSKVR